MLTQIKSKELFLICVMLFFSSTILGQTQDWLRQIETRSNVYGGTLTVAFDSDGFIYATGVSGENYYHETNSNAISNQGGEGFLIKMKSNGDLVWHRSLPSKSYLKIDRFDNLYLTGMGVSNFDFNPGPEETYSNSQVSNANRFIAKYDSDGNLVWVNGFSCPNGDFYAFSAYPEINLCLDNCGNAYITGVSSISLLVKQDNEVLASYSSGSIQTYLLKVNNSGVIEWCRHSNSSNGYLWVMDIIYNPDGNIMIYGNAANQLNMSLDENNIVLGGVENSYSGFISQFKPSGEFISTYTFADGLRCVMITDNNNIYISGFQFISNEFDFDLGPAVQNPSNDPFGMFIACYNGLENFKWVKFLTNSRLNTNYIKSMDFDLDGNIYATGSSSDMDLDMGPNEVIENNTGQTGCYFIAKWDSSGNYIWSNKYKFEIDYDGYTDQFIGLAIDVNSKNEIVTCGRFGFPVFLNQEDSMQVFSPFPIMNQIQAKSDGFIQKFIQPSCNNMELNFESISSVSCNENGLAIALIENASGSNSYSWGEGAIVNGRTAEFTKAGFYELVTTVDTCYRKTIFFVNGPSINGNYDLKAQVIVEDFNPGTETNIELNVLNSGCSNVSGLIEVELGSQLNFIQSLPAPFQVVGSKISWDFSNVSFQNENLPIKIQVETSETVISGDTINITTSIIPASNEIDAIKENWFYKIIDENDKRSELKFTYPMSICNDNYVLKDRPISTCIRFENLEHCSKRKILITDTLSSNLDLSTFRIISSSHDFIAELLSDTVIQFKSLNSINQNSSTSNLGHLFYEMRPKYDIPIGNKVIHRGAKIKYGNIENNILYESSHTLVEYLNDCDTTKKNIISSDYNYLLFPNPTTDFITIFRTLGLADVIKIEVFDLSGRLIKSFSYDNFSEVKIDFQTLSGGIYQCRITDNLKQEVHKVICTR